MTISEQLRKLLAEATPGDWVVNPFCAQIDCQQIQTYGDLLPVAQMLWPTDLRSEAETEANAALIVFLRNNAPHFATLEEENVRLREALVHAAPFVEALANNDPDEPIADNGMTVLGKLQYDAPALALQIRAALGATEMALIEQLERADGRPDRELFKAVFVAVHGPKPPRILGGSQELTDWLNLYNPFYRMLEAEAWTDAAMTLLSDPPRRVEFGGYDEGESCWAYIHTADDRVFESEGCANVPSAIAAAALRARSQGGE